MDEAQTPTPGSQSVPSRYRILEKLGGGGSGVVYKAEDTRLARFVALKFLLPEAQGDAHAQARFHREAQAASALNHQNICTVYDIGEMDGQLFIAMELLEGHTLREKIGGRALPLATLLDYAMQIAAALDAAHKHGIVHRDIKPSNIFITGNGSVKLADFGLAKRVMVESVAANEAPTISAPITARGTIVGTVAYMSPEQTQDFDIDARSDIFSFGIVLYEMATGKRAFAGESSATVIGEILHRAPKAMRELNPQVPESLEHIVARAMEKDREDRYQSAQDLMVDLRRLTKRETERSQSASVKLESEKSERRSRSWVWAGVGAIALLLVGIAVAQVIGGQQEDLGPPKLEQMTYTSTAKGGPLLTDGSRVYFNDEKQVVEMSVRGGATAPARASLAGMRLDDVAPDGSDFLAIKASDISDETFRGTVWSIPTLGGAPKRIGKTTARDAQYSPDGAFIAYAEKNSVYLSDAQGEHFHEIWNAHNQVRGPMAISEDGKRIRVTVTSSQEGSDPHLWEVNVDGSNAHRLDFGWPESEQTWGSHWIMHGTRFVFFSGKDGVASVYELIEPRWYEFWKKPRTERLTSGLMASVDLAASRDRSGFYMIGRVTQGQMQVYDAKEKRFVPYLEGLPALDVVPSPDGKWLAYVAYPQNTLWRCRPDGSERVQLSKGGVLIPSWSRDGKWIVYSDWKEIYRVSVDGGEPEQLTSEGNTEVMPSFSPDGRSVYFSDYPVDGRVRIKIVDLASKKTSVMPGSEGYLGPMWSPNGKFMIGYRIEPHTKSVYSTETKTWKELRITDNGYGFDVWSPDSKGIYVQRPPWKVEAGERPGIYLLRIDGEMELVAEWGDIKAPYEGEVTYVSLTPDGRLALMMDQSASQVYEAVWEKK
jgi:Tol biopolymer transport system component